jgi:hypothetical protein
MRNIPFIVSLIYTYDAVSERSCYIKGRTSNEQEQADSLGQCGKLRKVKWKQ